MGVLRSHAHILVSTMNLDRLQAPLLRASLLATVGLLPAAGLLAQETRPKPADLIAHGDFEAAAANLRLPEVSPFPLVAGGWGARGAETGQLTVVPDAAVGLRAVQLTSRPSSPTHLIQDVPLGTGSFVLEFRAQRLHGRQSVRILGDWDRMEPEAPDGLHLVLGAGGLRVRSEDGAWGIDWPETAGPWVTIRLVADRRTDQLRVWIDGELRATVPGRIEQPRTLVLGGHAGATSRFRYDGIHLFRLAELELAEIFALVEQVVPARDRRWVTDRLGAAGAALARGADEIARPEIRAAVRLLEEARTGRDDTAAAGLLARSMRALADLLEAS